MSFGLMGFFGVGAVPAQEMPDELPPFLDPSSDKGGSLFDLFKSDLLKRYQSEMDLSGTKNKLSRKRPSRPRPEMGSGRAREPADLSKFFGPESDYEKTADRLKDRLGYPGMAAPTVPSITPGLFDRWKDLPREKRFAFAADLFKRRKYATALQEYEALLKEELDKKERVEALTMREKCLFHRKHYATVEDDFFRLTSYFPKEKAIGELQTYLEEKSGVAALQKAVFENPSAPSSQRRLLDLYKHYKWLDFAETFFMQTIQDTSPATIESLSEVYYLKKDHDMLTELSRKAQELYPQQAEFYYNEGVGLYRIGDPASRIQAKTCFQKAAQHGPNTRLQNNINWYLKRLSPRTP